MTEFLISCTHGMIKIVAKVTVSGTYHVDSGTSCGTGISFTLVRVNFLQHESVLRQNTTLLRKSFTKFFKRHGAIIEKYGTTLRKIEVAIQN